jgi:hypothetical protein
MLATSQGVLLMAASTSRGRRQGFAAHLFLRVRKAIL